LLVDFSLDCSYTYDIPRAIVSFAHDRCPLFLMSEL
jgi:hypothetical protein